MSSKPIGLIERARRFSERQVNEYGAQYLAFVGYFLIFFCFAPYRWVNPGHYPEFVLYGLRYVANTLALLIALQWFWPRRIRPYLPLFWHFTLLYCFPFRTTFNILYSQHSSSFNKFGMLGIVALAVLVDTKSFLILLAVGIVSGTIFFIVTGGASATLPDNETIALAIVMYLAVVFTKLIFSRNNERAHKKKLEDFRTLASSIAHEIRAPLSTLAKSSSGLQMHLSTLTHSHKLASDAGLEVEPISDQNLDTIDTVARQIQEVSERGLRTIDQLLAQIRQSSSPDEKEQFSIVGAIERALHNHPWQSGQRDLVTLKKDCDFEVFGNASLFGQVISNLVNNSLNAIETAKKGSIQICLESSLLSRRVRIRDTGCGISPESLPHIFEHFYTTKKHGTGVGLALCKLIIEDLDGKLSCKSVPGEFAEFVITFPTLKIGNRI